MDINREKQHTTIAQTNQLLHSTERKRVLLRFQRGVVDLENSRYEILNNSEFVEKPIEYLFTIYQTGPEEAFLKSLVDVYLDKTEDRRDIAQYLLLHFGSKTAAVLVQCLTDC